MNIEKLRNYCLSKNKVTESFPFDNDTIVFKLFDKIFALFNIKEKSFINLKCDPLKAIELRERFNGISPGWHMNKKHWNSIYFNKDIDDDLLRELIDHSYEMVKIKLIKKFREQL